MLEVLMDPATGSVGGTFDKLELIRAADEVIATFSSDIQGTIFDNLPTVTTKAPVTCMTPIEPMGS